LTLFITILLGLVAVPLTGVLAQDGTAQGGVFEEYEVAPGERVEVPVEIRDVTDLYAVDLEIRFDPELIQVEDANPNVDGVQPALGTFLDAGLTLFNEVDNEEGVVRFVMTQVNPSEPKSGDGVLVVLYVVGVGEGESDLEVITLELSDRLGEAIPVEAVDGSITVSEEAVPVQSTAIPVQDPTGIVQVPTQAPTSTPTPTSIPPTPTLTAAATESAQSEGEGSAEDEDSVFIPMVESGSEQEGSQETEVGDEEPEARFILLEYWWIVLIVVGAVIAAAVYLLVKK
jgi:hypothetical protein